MIVQKEISAAEDKRVRFRFMIIFVVSFTSIASALAGPAAVPHAVKPAAPLDASLMAFKEHGVWYDLCEAPAFLVRIPPHYATYGPPPVPCCPIPMTGPRQHPVKVK